MDNMSDLVTHEECVQILTRHFKNENFELLDYTVEPFSDQYEGFMGEHYLLKIQVKRSKNTLFVSFFAKIPPMQHHVMEYVRACKAFEKEVFFYEVLMNDIKICYPTFDKSILPQFYFSKGNNMIVLENLHEKNFCTAPFENTLDVQHIQLVLKALAKFHSASIIYEERKSEEIGKTFRLIDYYDEMLTAGRYQEGENFLGQKWRTASKKAALNIIDLMDEIKISKSEFKKLFYYLTDRCIEIVKPSKNFRNVLTHGDLSLKNILFRYENDFPVECKFVDFQFIKYNPPAYDVLKIIYQSTTAKQRTHFVDFLKYYYDNLCKELKLGDVDPVKIISSDQFYASVKYMLPQCKLETFYSYTYNKFGLENLKTFIKNSKDVEVFTFIDRLMSIPQNYKPGSVYKKWVDEMMMEIKDMLLQYNITREDCYAILQQKLNTTNYDLISYSAIMLEENTGFQGQHLKLKIDIKLNDEEITHHFFVKQLPPPPFSDMVINVGSFDNEKFMFDEVFMKMSQFDVNTIYECIAHHYYSISNSILVFEDLNKHGFQIVNKYKPFNLNEMSVVIKCLAKFHASTLLLEERLTKINADKFRVENQYINNIKQTYFAKTEEHLGYLAVKCGVRGLCSTIDKFLDPDSTITSEQLKNLVNDYFKNKVYEQISPFKKYLNVICHGELWKNNIMMKYVSGQAVDCRFVDFQTVRICPPAHDVMTLIYLTTTRKFRANYMSDVLNLYYSELSNTLQQYEYNIKDILPLDDFLESCEEYKPFAINFTAILFPVIMLKSEEMEKLLNNQELSRAAIFINRSDFILDICEKDEHYKALLKASVKNHRDLYENLDSKYVLVH